MVRRADSIKEDESKPFMGLPRDKVASTSNLMAASGQRNQSNAYLRPIQEVNTEQSKIDSMASSNYNRASSNAFSAQMPSTRTQYNSIDPNDGKSSEEMLQFLRSVRH